MEKVKSDKELKSAEAGRIWEENKGLYLTQVVKGGVEHSTAHWLYGRPARLLETLYRTQYRNGFGHPEAEGRISVEKVREKALMGLRSQKAHLDTFQSEGLLTWGLLKAGQRRHGKVARKTGIWFRLNLQPLQDRTGEAEKARLQKETANAARTAKARAVKAERSTLPTPSGRLVSVPQKLTPELTSMFLGRKKDAPRQANTVGVQSLETRACEQ